MELAVQRLAQNTHNLPLMTFMTISISRKLNAFLEHQSPLFYTDNYSGRGTRRRSNFDIKLGWLEFPQITYVHVDNKTICYALI